MITVTTKNKIFGLFLLPVFESISPLYFFRIDLVIQILLWNHFALLRG